MEDLDRLVADGTEPVRGDRIELGRLARSEDVLAVTEEQPEFSGET